MAEMLRIRSAEEYFLEYGRDGIGKGADKWMIRRQLIDAFHKEMFGLVAMRTRKLAPGTEFQTYDPKIVTIIRNVTSETQRKWMKLCKIFAQYEETRGLLEIDDLKADKFENETVESLKN